MEKRNIIVIGASSGGVDALKKLIGRLPAHIDASIFIVWHMASSASGLLPQILGTVTSIPVHHALEGESIRTNQIYVAPPDYHMLVEVDRIRITHGPKENRFRPAIDPLFRSAALNYGNRVIGVILSGSLDDGTAGLWTIKRQGGIALVQDPREAEAPGMPESAIQQVDVDNVLPLEQLAMTLAILADQQVVPIEEMDMNERKKTEIEVRIAAQENDILMNVFPFGELTPYTCPECHGVLTMLREGSLTRFRCHTGHAYSIDTLLAAVTETIEDNLYDALRSFDEALILLNHVGDHYSEANQPKLAALYFQKAQELEEQAGLVRQAATSQQIVRQDILLQQASELSDKDTSV